MILKRFLDDRIVVKVGDITDEDADAIVNAANSSLLGGGGVDGAIHRAGGPKIVAECREIIRSKYPQGLPTGEAVITTGGNLKARYVIHTVGPVFGESRGSDAQLLANAYTNSLMVAVENNLSIIAFPSISTGVYSYPKKEAAEVSSLAIKAFLEDRSYISEVRLLFFKQADAEIFLLSHKF